jgi:hypothetical protein
MNLGRQGVLGYGTHECLVYRLSATSSPNCDLGSAQKKRAPQTELLCSQVKTNWTDSLKRSVLCPGALDYRSSTLDQVDDQDDDGQHQQQVNKPAEGVRTHHSEQPQNQKHHKYRPQHLIFPSFLCSTHNRNARAITQNHRHRSGQSTPGPSGALLTSEGEIPYVRKVNIHRGLGTNAV